MAQLSVEQQTAEAQRRHLEEQLAGERSRAETLTGQLEQQKEEGSTRIPQPEGQVPVATDTPATVVALNLLPGLPRGSRTVPLVEVTPALRAVRLKVGIELKDDYQRFRVELRSQEGRLVWNRENITAQSSRTRRTAVLSVPAKLLVSGRYELSLSGTTAAGTHEDLGYYYFEVLQNRKR